MSDVNPDHLNAVNAQLNSLKPSDVDPYSSFDIEPLYTLVAKPPQDIATTINTVTEELRQQFPEHYYYDPVQYHITLLPIDVEVTNEVLRTIQLILTGTPIEVILQGLGINKHGIAITAYTIDDSLLRLRNELRASFGVVLDYKEHAAVWDELLWIGIMRFKIRPSIEFLEHIKSFRDREFAQYTITEWQLYKTSSKVLAPNKSDLIHTFKV